MRQKLIRVSSLFLAMLLFVSAIFPSGSMTVHAASSLKAALKEESGKGIPADEGWSLYNEPDQRRLLLFYCFHGSHGLHAA